MNFIKKIREKSRGEKKILCLPETEDNRVIEAAQILVDEQLVKKVVLIGESDKIDIAEENIEIINFQNGPDFDKMVQKYYEKRKHKGITKADAREQLKDNLYYSAMLLDMNYVDAVVAGASHPTGDVLRAAIKGVGLKKNIETISSVFIMITDKKEFGYKGILGFADCAVVPDPDSQQLATIAESSAETFKNLLGVNPKVAFLSFSTKGSAKHEKVDNILKAIKLLDEKKVNFDYDGELQADAALLNAVAKKKAPESTIAGNANCLIFPSLEAGNIGYKLVQRFADAEAVGPIIQGLAKPYNDLSRGCSVDDIVNTACLALLNS
ncbi:MAG: phosphate acetyltransferase [Candidatus Mcinerneyibacterium aminivorans]|uniref:Phosphate acetyltransferase n=1 Tax=Candidatus Mcinerneyibacterium aminivorans TaxID=2703815 RepID=A0A5D0MG89_9BACT|nr:MAG: phosphate acetyltransferase [Candidatus Mcinerneyibacterium aminivorans]